LPGRAPGAAIDIEFEPVLHQALLEEWTTRDPD